MSNLLKFIKDNNIEIHALGNKIWICVPFYLISDFIESCSNDTHEYNLGEDGVFEEVALTKDFLSIDIESIIEALEEDINDYLIIAD